MSSQQSPALMISILDIEDQSSKVDGKPWNGMKLILTSPRSLFACQQEGILPKDLIYR